MFIKAVGSIQKIVLSVPSNGTIAASVQNSSVGKKTLAIQLEDDIKNSEFC